MNNQLEKKLQAIAGKLPSAVDGTRSITVLEGDVLRTVSGGGSSVSTGGGSSVSTGGGGGSRRR